MWRSSSFLLLFFGLAVCFAFACGSTDPSESSSDPVTESDGGASASLPPPSSSSSSSSSSGSSSSGSSSDGGDSAQTSTVCKTSFARDLLPMFDKAGCAALTCHGTPFGKDPRLAPDDVDLTYSALLAYQIAGKTYVTPASKDPNDSAMHCHFHGTCGAKMPPTGGSISQDFIDATDAWLACGSPKN